MSINSAKLLKDFLLPILADVEGKLGCRVEMDMDVSDGVLLAMAREAGTKKWKYSVLATAQECASTANNNYVPRLMSAAKSALRE